MRERLIEIQKRDGLTDGEMAKKLGCDRTNWNHIKHGRIRLTEARAVHAVGAWPELTRELLDLAEASREPVVRVTNTPEDPAPGAQAA